MEYFCTFIHTEWTDECMLNSINWIIKRKNISNEEGIYRFDDDKIIINWKKWEGNDIFIKIDNIYYHEEIYNNNSSYFIHNEWSDKCLLLNNIIKRKNINNENGTYKIIDNKIIIKWNNWNIEDIFIKYNNDYIFYSFYEEYIQNKNIIEYNLQKENLVLECIFNLENNIIYKKNKILEQGTFKINNNELIITWNNNIKENYIKINDIYQDKDLIENVILKIIKNDYVIEKFKKINNEYYLNTVSNIKEDIYHDNNNSYDIINFEIINDKIKNNLNFLINNNHNLLNNKNYLNIQNIKSFINNYEYEDYFYNLTHIDLNFKILPKKLKRCLTLVEWGYPPFGGGENWLLNFNKILSKYDYENYLICFSDPFKNEYFTNNTLIDIEYLKIIQMPKNTIEIIKIIKLINPDLINHQGVYREDFMKISNILEIPFLTGFCFWQNIIKFNQPDININMLSNNTLEKTDEFNFILKNSYTYSSSNFVNDVIYKLYNKNIDVIESISLKENFYINNDDYNNKKYVTLINCHYNKGGYLLKFLFENLDLNIPILLINTENDPVINLDYLNNLINERNMKNNINKLISEKIDIKIIYKKTRILLIPSICEETFCRVAYEGMINKIPILSTNNGNLKYLLKDYAIFINDFDYNEWKNNIENLYFNLDLIENFKTKNNNNNLTEEIIEDKIYKKINNIKLSKYKLNEKNIGLIVPWADQGLGIQGREYYISLKEIGYNPYVLSFRPYHATWDNIYLQSSSDEWKYDNIFYSENTREKITYDEILNFVYTNNIKQIFIIEATFINIFKIAMFLKLLNIKIYLVINIECIRLIELNYHNIFDKILTNNLESEIIMSTIFNNKSQFLGFNLNHHYFQDINKNIKFNLNKLKFCCMGGLNSITRKNINFIISAFYQIFNENHFTNWELNVYIQGVEIPQIIENYKCPNINYYVKNSSYKDIVEYYHLNDIFIHMGSHEGLGLGFFESLYCGTPIITMDWTPNNEIIKNNQNGWIINCDFSQIYDNDNSLIFKGSITEENIKKKIIEILNDQTNTLNIINNTIINKNDLRIKNKNIFNNNLLKTLS